MEGLKYIVEWNVYLHQEWSHVGMRPRERQCLENEGKCRGLVRISAVMSSVGIHIVENVLLETCS